MPSRTQRTPACDMALHMSACSSQSQNRRAAPGACVALICAGRPCRRCGLPPVRRRQPHTTRSGHSPHPDPHPCGYHSQEEHGHHVTHHNNLYQHLGWSLRSASRTTTTPASTWEGAAGQLYFWPTALVLVAMMLPWTTMGISLQLLSRTLML